MADLTARTFRVSEVKSFKACPRSWWLQYQRSGSGWKPRPSDKPASGKRDVGTLFHACVEALRVGNEPWRAPLIVAEHNLKNDLGVEKLPKEWADVIKLVTVMVEGYIEWIGRTGADASDVTLATELAVSMPLGTFRGDDVTLVGHIDHLVKDRITHETFVSDYKTVQSLDQAADTLQVDDQGLNYCILASHHTGEPVRRFRHDMARKTLRTARATPPFYGRQDVRYSETQIDSAWVHLVATVDRMVEALQRVEASEEMHHAALVPSPSKDCSWRCDFMAICPMLDDGSDWRGALEDSGLYVPREGKSDNG